MVQDDNGFLWVATDNGVSRFDGKRFVNYNTKNGLPSNDAINVIKQKDGTIWVNTYKQPPSYFDEKLNRFVCLDFDKHVKELSTALFQDIYAVNKNDLFFHNYIGSFIFSKGKIIDKVKINENEKANDVNKLYFKNELVNIKTREVFVNDKKNKSIDFYKNSQFLGSVQYVDANNSFIQYFDNYGIYRYSDKEITQIKINKLHPLQYDIQKLTVPENIKWLKLSSDKLSLMSKSGTIYIYDEKNLKLLSTIPNEFNVNTAYVDSKNNIWVATVNNGLMCYTDQTIKKEHYSTGVISNFLSAKVSDDGSVYAGNYQGEIYVKKGKTETKYNFSTLKDNTIWIRNFHFFPGKTIIVSDEGILINLKKKLNFYTKTNRRQNVKTSLKLNENELILGGTAGLVKYNVNTDHYEFLNFSQERILNLKRDDDHSFYFSAIDGLYRYDLSKNKYQLIVPNHLFQNDTIEHFEPVSKSRMWISTYKGNLYLLENNTIKKEFINDKRIPNNISKLLNINTQLWMGSKSGIFILNYANLEKVSLSKLTTSDGLTSNVVNFLDLKKDTVYAATDNGVSKIPSQIIQKELQLQPKIISIKINEKTVALDSTYQLKSDQNNISLELAGVDITGHFKNFQYAVNKDKFSDIEGNFLNLQLNSGVNKIEIRVVDENNKIYQNAIKLTFEIETPFYKTIWFWILVSVLTSTLIYYSINREKSMQQKRKFNHETDLHNQREKITADLHDDLGASLSSLQINSAVAQKVLDKNPTEAKKILNKIETQAKSISENIGDIIWSLKPHQDEFMTLSTRIKKITSEILGSSNIRYEILIDIIIDSEITDFSARKNLILICKEALNNILKHSQANEVCLILQKSKEHYILEIEDDGIGFTELEKRGNGVSNMRRRTEELGGKFQIYKGIGTKLIFSIPIIRET